MRKPWLSAVLLLIGTLISFAQGRFAVVEDLLAVTPGVNGAQAIVDGRVSANDGGGGIFVYDSGSAVSTNTLTIFKPANSAGRWLRMYSGEINLHWAPVIGDGVTDDSAAVQAWLTLLNSGGIEGYVPPGRYLISSTVGITNAVERELTIRGAGANTQSTGTGSCFVLGAALANTNTALLNLNGNWGSSDASVSISDIAFDGQGRVGSGLLLNGWAQGAQIDDCAFFNFAGRGLWINQVINGIEGNRVTSQNNNIGLDHDGSSSVGEGAFTACIFASNTNRNVVLNSGSSFLSFYGCKFFGAPTIPGVVIDSAGPAEIFTIGFYECSFESSTPAIWIPTGSEVNGLKVSGGSMSPVVNSGTSACIYVQGELNGSRISNVILNPTAAVGATAYGISIAAGANNLIGSNTWSPGGGGGTETEFDISALTSGLVFKASSIRTGAGEISLMPAGGSGAQFDANTTAGNTRFLLYDVDNGQLERVSVGIADSGGVGFKVLRIPN